MKNVLTDALGSTGSKSWPLQDALKLISEVEQGVLVLLSWPDEDAAVLQWMAQILVDIGVRKMKLMTAPKVIHGLAGFGLEVVDYVSGDGS